MRNAQKLAERTQAWDPLSDKQIRGNAYRTLFVARLSYDVVESDLEKEFSRYGPIERIRVVREKDSDKSRGYAFIEFERERDLKGMLLHMIFYLLLKIIICLFSFSFVLTRF